MVVRGRAGDRQPPLQLAGGPSIQPASHTRTDALAPRVPWFPHPSTRRLWSNRPAAGGACTIAQGLALGGGGSLSGRAKHESWNGREWLGVRLALECWAMGPHPQLGGFRPDCLGAEVGPPRQPCRRRRCCCCLLVRA
jgi:hypothetical protein